MMRFVCPILFVMSSDSMNFKAIGYESVSLNRIIADKLYCVILGLRISFADILKFRIYCPECNKFSDLLENAMQLKPLQNLSLFRPIFYEWQQVKVWNSAIIHQFFSL